MMKKSIYNILLALGLSIAVCAGSQAIVVQDSLMVTDVTPVQFCVVWTTTEPATGWIDLFENQEGTIPYQDPDGVIKIKFQSSEHPPAEDIGVLKVNVTGLKPNTVYFFRTETTAKDDNAVFLSAIETVRTERESIPIRNDVIAMKVTVGQTKPAPGMLVVASILDNASNLISSYPVTGWVGSGVAAQYVLIDTNNFYYDGTNFQVADDLQIKLKLVGGIKGSVETQDVLPNPKDTNGVQSLSVAANLPDAGAGPSPDPDNSVSAESGGGGGGAGCFMSAAASDFEADFPMPAAYVVLPVILSFAAFWIVLRRRKI